MPAAKTAPSSFPRINIDGITERNNERHNEARIEAERAPTKINAPMPISEVKLRDGAAIGIVH
jgi:hypothetical protein